MNAERKLIQLFRSFVEKSLVPQIRKFEGNLSDWHKFSALISTENINYGELQLYVDTLPSLSSNTLERPSQYKKREDGEPEFGSFNPSKTFGGERNSLKMFQMPSEASRDSQRDDSMRKKGNQNANGVLSGLQKLLRSLEENQSIIQNLGKESITKSVKTNAGSNVSSGSTGNNPTPIKQPPIGYSSPYQPPAPGLYTYSSHGGGQGGYKGY